MQIGFPDIYTSHSLLFPEDSYPNMLMQNMQDKRMLTSCLYCSPTFFYFHRQFKCFICVAYSAGQTLCTDALNVVDFQFTCDGHNPIFVLDCLLCRSRIEQVVPGDGGLWEAISIADDYQMTFRNVVMDRCIKTFQHTNDTSHHHSEHLFISSSSSLAIMNQSKA